MTTKLAQRIAERIKHRATTYAQRNHWTGIAQDMVDGVYSDILTDVPVVSEETRVCIEHVASLINEDARFDANYGTCNPLVPWVKPADRILVSTELLRIAGAK